VVKGSVVRKLSGMLLMLLLAVLLTACGSDDDDEPTAAPVEPTATVAATVASTPDREEATPGTLVASPVTAGTPIASPVAGASPVATPVTGATPMAGATPDAGSGGIVAPVTTGGDGTPVAGGLLALSGTVSLPGTINERFVISDDGCVGLGKYAGVQAGQQVVVKDEVGAIIGVTQLEATESAVVCSWIFEVAVPESGFYAVSIPLIAEHVYTGEDVAANGGHVELELP
jgi:hypothetical protein